jgi:1-acyl-sn-glycerol-3-phosphate acyltransferase
MRLSHTPNCIFWTRTLELYNRFHGFGLTQLTLNLMFYLLKLSLFLLITVPAAVLTILFGLFDAHGKSAYRLSQLWTALLLRLGGVVLKVTGSEHIDPSQQYVFMVNHQSNLDIPILVQSLRSFQLRWIAKRELLWIPFFGWAMWASRHITVDRADPLDAIRSLKRAKERIAAGISIVVFPEGTRSRDGKLLRFKKGGFLLAAQSSRPIVPITINGSRQVLPAGAWHLRSGTIEVTISQPIAADGFGPGTLRHLSNQVRQAIERQLRSAPPVHLTSPAADSEQGIMSNSSLERRSI